MRRADNKSCGKEKGKVELSIDPNKFNDDNCVLHRFFTELGRGSLG